TDSISGRMDCNEGICYRTIHNRRQGKQVFIRKRRFRPQAKELLRIQEPLGIESGADPPRAATQAACICNQFRTIPVLIITATNKFPPIIEPYPVTEHKLPKSPGAMQAFAEGRLWLLAERLRLIIGPLKAPTWPKL